MSDPMIRLMPVLPLWIVCAIVAALFSFMLWVELKKTAGLRTFRVVAVTIMTVAILGLLLRPQLQGQSDPTFLLTRNYDKGTLDSLLEAHPGAEVIDLSMQQPSSQDSMTDAAPRVGSVLGEGLSPGWRDLMGKNSFRYFPSILPHGIISLHVPKIIYAQTPTILSGTFHNTGRDSIKIVIEGPGGPEDSVTLTGRGLRPFELTIKPKTAGHFLYSLRIGKQTEFLPVSAVATPVLRILLIQSFPTFEARYLKDHLRASHSVVGRSMVSRNTFRYEYFNAATIRVSRITRETLDDFDLLIIDSDALVNTPAREFDDILASIEDGLGVLVLSSAFPANEGRVREITGAMFEKSSADSARINMSRQIVIPTWPVKIKNANRIVPTIATRDRILAGYRYRGFGKGGFSILQETFKLTLEGDSVSYRDLWNTIIFKNARTRAAHNSITPEEPFPYFPFDPLPLEIIAPSLLPKLLYDTTAIPLSEHVVFDELWRTTIWPANAGWHLLQMSGDSARTALYVSEP
ncbi:MAG TPA: hypothetical protein VEB86_08385, partial [Chryseosolibacter sp.]|nr:hypothetical protein [Chryseosolibacter sp.]